MIEIDVAKASTQYHRQRNKSLPPTCYTNDDTDVSEPDTALNTPTGSMTDSFNRRFSFSSSSTSFKSYHNIPQRKPSFTPKSPEFPSQPSIVDILEKKIQVLENDLTDHIKREADLQSQVLMLTEKQTESSDQKYKSTLTRISKQVEKFLVTHQNNNKRDSSLCWSSDESWIGSEIPNLYGDSGDEQTTYNQENRMGEASASSTIPIILIFRLKSMIENFMSNADRCIINNQSIQGFFTELSRTLCSWQEFYHTKLVQDQQKVNQEQKRVTRLLEALQKVLIKNKLMKRDHAILIKKYKADMKSMANEAKYKQILMMNSKSEDKTFERKKGDEEAEQKCRREELEALQKSFARTRNLLESQISELEKELSNCQDERDEYETTLEMVRREMETMLEELEDTRQQRLRYKTQASRLRAGLEAIQKRREKNNHSSHEEDSSNDDNEEDEEREAIRLMYNEAERQAVDLDRECKRQALTMSSIRKELKLAEEKYHAVKSEKSNELKRLQQLNQKLSREVELLQMEKSELISSQQQKDQQLLSTSNSKVSIATSSSSTVNNDNYCDDEHLQYLAKIYTLQIALKAAKSDLVIQRTRVSQLERQSSPADIDHDFVAGLQHLFKKELVTTLPNNDVNEEKIKEIADIIEMEQKIWKIENGKNFQKQYDINLLRVNRELRFLSCRLNDVEDETIVLKSRHEEQLSLVKYQISTEFEKKIQQLTSRHQLEVQELQNQLDILFQKNKTLEDESLILYGRNMLMAHKLGRIEA